MIRFNNKVVPQGYDLILEKQFNIIYTDCFVAVDSIALIKRIKVNGFFVRCAFRNLNDSPVSAVRADILIKNAEGKVVQSIKDYQFDGFYGVRGSIFGQTIAIPVETKEEADISDAEVLIREVFFDDGNQIKCVAEGITLPAEEQLADYFGEGELTEYYKEKVKHTGALVPIRNNEWWRCSCGAVNKADDEVCFECEAQKLLLFENLDKDNLKEELDELKRQREEEERIRLEEEAKEQAIKKKKQKKVGIITAVVLAVLILAYVFVTYLLPSIRYNSACDAMDAGDYGKAVEVFEKLGDYEDSHVFFLQCKYEYGIQQRNAGEYESALNIFEELGTYKDSRDQVTETLYLKGEKMIEDGQYKEAAELFSQLGSYKESKSKRLEAMYGFVCEAKDSKDRYTYKCINVLMGAKYKDIKKVYDRLYKWNVSIVMNNSEKDTETSMNKISKRDKIYCHVTLSGGEPDGKTKLKYSATYPDGSTSKGQWSDAWKEGEGGWASFWYDIPEYGSTGTFEVKIYNTADGKLLGKSSVELTK